MRTRIEELKSRILKLNKLETNLQTEEAKKPALEERASKKIGSSNQPTKDAKKAEAELKSVNSNIERFKEEKDSRDKTVAEINNYIVELQALDNDKKIRAF